MMIQPEYGAPIFSDACPWGLLGREVGVYVQFGINYPQFIQPPSYNKLRCQ